MPALTKPVLAARALCACQRYYEISEEIRRATYQMDVASCSEDTAAENSSAVGLLGGQFIAVGETCLDRMFRRNKSRRRFGLTEKLCYGCQFKYDAIQKRKDLRQKLGAAKREINRVGKMA